MAVNRFLAFDLGAESGRAVLGTLEGDRLTLQERHRFPNPYGKIRGRLVWNLLAQWEELKRGLRKTAGYEASSPVQLDGIGVDTWGVDFGLISTSGQVICNPSMYRDARPEQIAETFKIVPRERIYELTGLQFMPFNTLYQLLTLKQIGRAELESAKSMLLMPDLFGYLFSGESRGELSIVSTTQMYDPRKKQWSRELLEAVGLPTSILPPIVPSGTVLGPMLDDVASECGTSRVPVIAPGGHDTASSVAAVPATGSNWCYISSGTWSLMGVELDEPIINAKALKYDYTNEIGVGGKVRFLKNIMGLWLVQECRRHWQRQGSDHNYAELTAMAESAEPFVAYVNPDHGPFFAPGNMVGKIDEFCGQTGQAAPQSRGEYVRSSLEGLALTYRRTLDGLEDILGRRIDVIHIVGGGTQNQLLNQMTADACGRTVVAGPIEATSIGNILVQAMAIGRVRTLADARAIVRGSFDVKTYEPRSMAEWDKAHERFSEIVARTPSQI